MGRPKKELKRIHRKKIRKAKQKIQAYSKKEIHYENLTKLAKTSLQKGKKRKSASS